MYNVLQINFILKQMRLHFKKLNKTSFNTFMAVFIMTWLSNEPSNDMRNINFVFMSTYVILFSQDYGLASHTTHVWALILYVSTPNDKFLRNFFMAGLFILRVFERNLLGENCRRNIFVFIFRFDVWPRVYV